MSKLLIKIDANKCIGCGSCESVAESIFRVNAKGKAEVWGEGDDEQAILAAQVCPTSAIEIKNSETGEIIWPKSKQQKGGDNDEK